MYCYFIFPVSPFIQTPDCNAGTYYDEEIKSCKACYPGRYQDFSGETGCKSCPAGTTSSEGAASLNECTDCEEGMFWAENMKTAKHLN